MAGLSGNILEQTNVGGTDYNFRDLDRGCEFIYGTQTATTGSWTGVTTDTELIDGKQILYFLPFAGSGNATLNLTLADGTTTGAKNVYFQSTTRMTTHYGQYTQFRLIYHANHKIGNTYYEGWWSEPGRDTTTTNATQIQLNSNALKAGSSALTAGNIIVANNDGLYKHLKTGTAFDITYPIVYLAENVAATKATNNVYTEINFTVATTQSITLTAQKPVFIKGTLSGKTFTPISTAPLTQTIPSSADGYHYIYLGYGYATTAIRLQPYHPIFAYINGAFNLYTGVSSYASSAGNAATVNNHTVAKDVPSDAKFTDHEYSGTGLISVSNAGVISTTATANTGTITSVKTTAGAHSTINVTSGAANFNVPTKTSHLTNDSGFVTTDTNTTYTLSADTTNNKITLTPSEGTTQSITVPYATSAGTANSATSANSLNVGDIGNDSFPVYFDDGLPVASSQPIYNVRQVKQQADTQIPIMLSSFTYNQFDTENDNYGPICAQPEFRYNPATKSLRGIDKLNGCYVADSPAHKVFSKELANPSCASGTEVTITGINDLDEGHTYLIMAYFSFGTSNVSKECVGKISVTGSDGPTARGVLAKGGGMWTFHIFTVPTGGDTPNLKVTQYSGSTTTMSKGYMYAILLY